MMTFLAIPLYSNGFLRLRWSTGGTVQDANRELYIEENHACDTPLTRITPQLFRSFTVCYLLLYSGDVKSYPE